MNFSKSLLIASLFVSLAAGVAAQTSRRRTGSRAVAPKAAAPPQATPEPVAPPVSDPKPPTALAIVNGQTITSADIDPKAAEEAEALDERIAEARRQVVELQINTVLLDVEARKRKITAHQLYELEVKKRIIEPTDAEITKFIEDNHDQVSEGNPATVRVQATAFLRSESEGKISNELVKRLRTSIPVVMGADINAPNLGASAVVATVAGKAITAGVVNERLKPIIYKLRLDAYEGEKEALERTIKDVLLLAEAQRRGVAPEEIVRKEVSEKLRPPTEAEVVKFYSENKGRITGDLDSVRNQIAIYLQDQDQQRWDRTLSERLRKGADIRLLISEPEALILPVSTDDDPSRGEANAAVTIVEFTDFQCPACAAMQPVLEEVLKAYGNKVRFVVRDFPLSLHANARKAAEAADAAYAQGKFFEYTALLFKRQNALDVPSLKKYASELGLDRARFDAALDSGTYAAEVQHDIDDGVMYGVGSTPTIFINGVRLQTLSAEALRAELDRLLVAGSSKTPK
jgi:predicted DsbA family dithiol-disulfide isomerase